MFYCFYTFFVEVSTDLVDWNIAKDQQAKDWLSSSLFEEFIAFF